MPGPAPRPAQVSPEPTRADEAAQRCFSAGRVLCSVDLAEPKTQAQRGSDRPRSHSTRWRRRGRDPARRRPDRDPLLPARRSPTTLHTPHPHSAPNFKQQAKREKLKGRGVSLRSLRWIQGSELSNLGPSSPGWGEAEGGQACSADPGSAGGRLGGLRKGLTQVQSYSWRRPAELGGRGWSRDRPRRFRPWEASGPGRALPRPAWPTPASLRPRRVPAYQAAGVLRPGSSFVGVGGVG